MEQLPFTCDVKVSVSLGDKTFGTIVIELRAKVLHALIVEVLTATSGNVKELSKILQVDRSNIYRILRKLNIKPESFRVPKP